MPKSGSAQSRKRNQKESKSKFSGENPINNENAVVKKKKPLLKETPFGMNRFLHYVLFPILIMISTAFFSLAVFVIVDKHNGSISAFVTSFSIEHFIESCPKPSLKVRSCFWFSFFHSFPDLGLIT